MDFERIWRSGLDDLAYHKRLRSLRPVERTGGGIARRDGRDLADFSSNDYLGLSHHPQLIARAGEWAVRHGVGAGGSRLVSGDSAPIHGIEAKLAEAKGAEAALLMVSGFQANISVLPAVLDARILREAPRVFADRLIHASMIQGCLAAGVTPTRYRHNDLDHLAMLIERHRDGRPIVILTETVFSMDGDRADLPALQALAERYEAFLYLDEAHATGLFGARGFGLACGMAGPRCLVMGTFGKALGGFGAYAAGTAALREHLVNHCGGLIYATALPPPMLGAIDAAIDLVPSLDAERALVLARAERFRQAVRAAGLDYGTSTTQIVPILFGSEARALAAARLLEEQDILAVAIRPPTVPSGTSRIRFAFSAAQREQDIARLIALLPTLAGLPE